MQQIINFIIRNKSFLLFLLLFSLGVFFTIQSHSYHKSKFINSANFLSGGIYNSLNGFTSYFSLKSQNEMLSEENKRLKAIVYNSGRDQDSTYIDTASYGENYQFSTAKIIRNSYSASANILLINKGRHDSINEDFGVITSKGIVGIINNVSNNYATVISVLNTTSKISAQLQKTNHFGTLTWDGNSTAYAQLTDIPKIAPLKTGDTIVTSGRSSIFPKGIPVGTVANFNLGEAENYYTINLKLFNDMTNLEHIQIIENKNSPEINTLLNE
ncbi:rod shape-determining protein MreC [Changchengzhania lutea]|uniref:rod shape-determining protein MreC n=1 Tax=Changchengzhania lutea TaxID=2049305 RepID=UPI00115EBB88|nr:rod shape-determining protein MreC [Changchengzhania lutea]